jgi:hypothetical protein
MESGGHRGITGRNHRERGYGNARLRMRGFECEARLLWQPLFVPLAQAAEDVGLDVALRIRPP